MLFSLAQNNYLPEEQRGAFFGLFQLKIDSIIKNANH